jgi:hypothetical protein
MSARSPDSPREGSETISDLRRRLGLFSFQPDEPTVEGSLRVGAFAALGVRPGGIVEWLAAAPGAGAFAFAPHVSSQSLSQKHVTAIVDFAGECYAPALSGWGVRLGQTLFVRPTTRLEACWAIEQCLRCPGVSATWAWVDQGLSPRVHRRWQLAAEAGGGVGVIFRPEAARREPAWADLRLLVAPRPGGRGETRRVRIDVLYRRGGLGGTAQVWEIDHAEGVVRLVPEVAGPAVVGHETRA